MSKAANALLLVTAGPPAASGDDLWDGFRETSALEWLSPGWNRMLAVATGGARQ